jgi:hypothetical protein
VDKTLTDGDESTTMGLAALFAVDGEKSKFD